MNVQIAALLKPRMKMAHPVSDEVSAVVFRAWAGGFTVQSDFARENAVAVAEAACRGYITTNYNNTHGRTWFVTQGGLDAITVAL